MTVKKTFVILHVYKTSVFETLRDRNDNF